MPKQGIFHHVRVPTRFNALGGPEGTTVGILVLQHSLLAGFVIHGSAPIQILSTGPQLNLSLLMTTLLFLLSSLSSSGPMVGITEFSDYPGSYCFIPHM